MIMLWSMFVDEDKERRNWVLDRLWLIRTEEQKDKTSQWVSYNLKFFVWYCRRLAIVLRSRIMPVEYCQAKRG
jgi:hypothetical protein